MYTLKPKKILVLLLSMIEKSILQILIVVLSISRLFILKSSIDQPFPMVAIP